MNYKYEFRPLINVVIFFSLLAVLVPMTVLAQEYVTASQAKDSHEQMWSVIAAGAGFAFTLLQILGVWILSRLSGDIRDLKTADTELTSRLSTTREELAKEYVRRNELNELKRELHDRLDKMDDSIKCYATDIKEWLTDHENREFALLRKGPAREG